MAYSIRTRHYLTSNNISTDAEYIKQLYKKNTAWNLTEEKITQFENEIKYNQQKKINKNIKTYSTNLVTIQWRALPTLWKNKNLIIKPTDKNLGPALMDLESYIKQVLREHLLTPDYIQLPQTEMKHQMDNLKSTLKSIIKNNQDKLSKAETTYFQ
jgi:hypothetical protein